MSNYSDPNGSYFKKSELSEEKSNQIASDLLRLLNQKPGYVNVQSPGLTTIEQAILRSQYPIKISETEEVSFFGMRGIYANKSEVANWKGDLDISEYEINEDTSPEVITKRTLDTMEYVQELAVRYLQPPTPPPPGDIIINQGN